MTLIRHSKGGFSHDQIMELTFSQFYNYLDALNYCINNESKEGQKENAKLDHNEELRDLSNQDIDEIKRKVAIHKARQLSLKQSNGRQENK